MATKETQLAKLKILLNPNESENLPTDDVLNEFLDTARDEIIAWKYNSQVEQADEYISDDDKTIQIYAVIAGYSTSGGENEVSHNENGIQRTFKYSDMVAYIHSNVIPYAVII